MINVQDLISLLKASKLDARVDVRNSTDQESKKIQRLISALSEFIVDYQKVAESKQARVKAAELLVLVKKIKDPMESGIMSFEDGVVRKTEANNLIDSVIANLAFVSGGAGGKAQGIQITDPTNTNMGKFLAMHFAAIIQIAAQEKTANQTVFEKIIAKGGYGSTMYERIHQPLDPGFAKNIYSLVHQEIEKILPNVPDAELEERYKDYLFDKIPSVLAGTLFRYSKSMSAKQKMNMLWMHSTHILDIADSELLTERRIYVAINLAKAREAVRFIAQAVSEFLTKNPKFAPFIYFKFKIRVIISEADRADTLVGYLKFKKGIEQYQTQILQGIFNRIRAIPAEFLHQMSSPVLTELKPGVTTVDDTGIITDPNESYTSQVGKTFYQNLIKHAGKNPKTPAEFQAIASQVIKDTIVELRKRNYKV